MINIYKTINCNTCGVVFLCRLVSVSASTSLTLDTILPPHLQSRGPGPTGTRRTPRPQSTCPGTGQRLGWRPAQASVAGRWAWHRPPGAGHMCCSTEIWERV